MPAHGFAGEGEKPGEQTRWRTINETVGSTAAEKRASCRTGAKNYRSGDAPTICVTGSDHKAKGPDGKFLEHARIGRLQAVPEAVAARTRGSWTYAESRDAGCEAAAEVLKPCTAACFKAQLDHYHLSDPPDGAGLEEDQEAHAGVFDGSSEEAESILADQATNGVLF